MVSAISISPSAIYTGTQVSCAAAATDPDEGPLLPNYQWTLGGQILSTSSSYIVQADETNVGDSLTCTATAVDSSGLSTNSFSSITIENTLPIITDLSITPSSAIYNDTSISCIANVLDPDESLNVQYEWKLNNNPLALGSSLNLNSYTISPSDQLECFASVHDSMGGTAEANTIRLVENRAPIVTNVSLNTLSPQADTLMECSSIVSDPDGELLQPSYEWTLNGSLLGTTSTVQLDASIAPVGEILICTASVVDAASATDSASATTTIENTAPIMGLVSIQPDSDLNVQSTLTCAADGYDLNDGTLNPIYTWTNTTTGIVIGSNETLSLNPSLVSANDNIECTVTFTDNDGSSINASFSVEVLNGSPSFDRAAEIIPNTSVRTGTTLVCSAEASDPEEGPLSPSYTWTLGGQLLSSSHTYTVNAIETDVGDQLICTAHVFDSTGETATTTAYVTVENTEPIIDSISLSTSTLYNDEDIECTATVVDPDELQPLTISYSWTTGSSLLGTGTSLDLSTTSSIPGDQLSCVAEATDSQGATTSNNTQASIDNRRPTAPSVHLSPRNTNCRTRSSGLQHRNREHRCRWRYNHL